MANALISNINIEQAARSVTGFAVFRGCNYYFFRVHRKPQHLLCLLQRKGTWGALLPGPAVQGSAQPPQLLPLCSRSELINPEPINLSPQLRCAGGGGCWVLSRG